MTIRRSSAEGRSLGYAPLEQYFHLPEQLRVGQCVLEVIEMMAIYPSPKVIPDWISPLVY